MTTVLLVEDDAWLAEGEVKTLEDAGYAVVYAPHAQSAIVRLDERTPDVIVLDMLLTGATAMALLHELQSYTDSRAIPIILCTNIADSLRLDDLHPYGVRRIIDKTTMQPDDIVVAIRSLL
jgi:CheY-like chemotaxis protein